MKCHFLRGFSLSVSLICFYSMNIFSNINEDDLGHQVNGSEVEDILGKSQRQLKPSSYIENDVTDLIDSWPDFENQDQAHQSEMAEDKTYQSESIGYKPVGTFDNTTELIESDKRELMNLNKKKASSGLNFSYLLNNFQYQSPNNVINRTFKDSTEGKRSGFLLLRSDQYFSKTDFFNMFWSLGAGFELNYGKGIFTANGLQSSATFRLWEVPVDLGIGFEFHLFQHLKMIFNAGPSAMILLQNRSDLTPSEKGINKVQVSYGPYASAQFKLSMTAFSPDLAYLQMIEGKFANMFLTLEGRYHSYTHFLDPIGIEGVTFGAGFSFEFL